jgi:hypothetical protein
MDELFRFTLIRPADRLVAPTTITVQQPTVLQRELMDAKAEFDLMRRVASTYLGGQDANANTKPLGTIQDLPLYAPLSAFRSSVLALPDPTTVVALKAAYGSAFPTPPDANTWAQNRAQLVDNFVALYIAPRRDRPSLIEIADVLRTMDLAARVSAGDATLAQPGGVQTALNLSLLLPPNIFQVPDSRVRPVGIADLLLVKQHISRYELGEIARIENILKGETRQHTQKHTLTTSTTTTVDQTTTTETSTELTTNDTVSMKTEIDNSLKEDFNTKAGVQLSIHGGSYDVKSNLDFAYDRSQTNASKFASDVSKQVTQKAASKVTERIQRTQTTTITESIEDLEDQGFDNTQGQAHVSGVYQWVDKVYLAQVFNYGKHLLFDLMVPEPAALLLDAARLPPKDTPVAPPPFGTVNADGSVTPINPLSISDDPTDKTNFYGTWVGLYEATDVEPPPPASVTVAKAISAHEGDGNSDILVSDTIRLQDGYSATQLTLNAAWYDRGDSKLNVTVGQVLFPFRNGGGGTTDSGQDHYNNQQKGANNEEGEIPVAVESAYVTQATVGIEVSCTRTATLLAKWKIQTYEKIAARYQKLYADYQSALAQEQFQQKTLPLGRDPDTNRMTERTELKRACIAILSGSDLQGNNDVKPGGFPTDPPLPDPTKRFPETNLPAALAHGPFVRFFEDAFEWDKIGYVFYPYFWGRPDTWYDKITLANDDPLFENFLRAGYARVVVPVRPGFEDAFQYYLVTGQVWMGGGLPSVSDPTYLPIAEEMKEQLGAPGSETPVGDSWEFRLPTQLIKLRKDDALPTWTRSGNYPPPPPTSWDFTEDNTGTA